MQGYCHTQKISTRRSSLDWVNPYGPISWGDELGAERILLILERIYGLTGDPRYRPSPWLQRRAKLGISLFTQQSNFSC